MPLQTATASRLSKRARAIALTCGGLVLAALLSTGCAFGEFRWHDPLQREISLEDAQHRYTVLVRWSDFEKASAFVDPDERADFLAQAPHFRDFRFTEYESNPVEIDKESGTATIEVTYYAYTPVTPLEVSVRETQVWYRDAGVGNNWRVRSSFEGIDALLPAKGRRAAQR